MDLHSPERYVNTKVATGFALLLIIAVISFLINYFGVVQYIQADKKEDPLGQRLMTLNELIFKLQEADGAARLYNLSGNKKDRETYSRLSDSVVSTIDKLDQYFPEKDFSAEIDTIRNLYLQKKEQTDQLIELSIINRYRHRYGEVLSMLPDSINFQISQITYSSLHVDSASSASATPTETKNFFGRIARLLSGRDEHAPQKAKTPGISQKVDSSMITKVRKDPALEEVKNQLEKLDKQDKRFASLLAKREQKLVQLLNKLTNTIRQIVKYLENQAILESVAQQQKMDNMKSELLKRLILLGFSSLLIILGFIMWIGRDLRKSKHLKEQIISSGKKVESLMKAKERFLASMSHEIRTPLTAIIGFSELLKDKEPKAEIIHHSSIHLLSLVNDVLDFSGLEAGKLNLRKETVNPRELIDEIGGIFKRNTEEKRIKFSYTTAPDTPPFIADKTRLRQIIINLVGNAIKFTREGYVSISLKKENDQLIIMVKDSGCGIPPHRINKIFEEFAQISNPSLIQENGTGLGLAISKKLTEAMGGKIKVDSTEGIGSTFIVQIPFIESSKIQKKPDSHVADIFGKQILVVDDDPLVGQLMEGFLSKKNRIVFLKSPAEAKNILRHQKFDLIITDYRMPEMNGLNFAKSVKDLHNGPILLLSAGINEKSIDVSLHLKNVFQMSKPFSRNELNQKFHSIFEETTTETKPATAPKTSNNRLFDLSQVKNFTGTDTEFLNSVIETFIKDTDDNIATLKILISHHEYGQISEQAHKMLTGFRQFGIADGANILKGIEIIGRKPGNTPELKRGLKRLKLLWKKVKESLSNELISNH